MEFSLEQIAEILNGKIEGNPSDVVKNISKIEEASEHDLCFLANEKYESHIYGTKATAIIVNDSFKPTNGVETNLIRVKDAYSAFSQIMEMYQTLIERKKGIEKPSYKGKNVNVGKNIYRGAFSYIGNGTKIGDDVQIYPNVSIGENVSIADNCVLYAGVKIYDDCVIGKNCRIQAGAVIGSEGFGFAPQEDGTFKPVPQLGNVILGNNVDVGANTTIDCATMGSTVIGNGSKIDNLVQIAHNVEIGNDTGVAAQAGISGSTKIGDNCIIAGQVGLVGHLTIANKTTIGAQSGVSKSVKLEGTFIQGSPAFDYKQNLKSQVIFRKLPDLDSQIKELQEKILNLPQS